MQLSVPSQYRLRKRFIEPQATSKMKLKEIFLTVSTNDTQRLVNSVVSEYSLTWGITYKLSKDLASKINIDS